ncbi:MAG: DUF3298 and DUF4163 domain-containing protein [Chlorobi bacterium]|nr:DUF3298 and DUF4163 domain-containing protein [Chlorobiota bacterium]
MRRIALIVAAFSILLTSFACSTKESGGVALRFKVKEFERSKTFGDSSRTVSVLIEYPEFVFPKNQKVAEALNSFVDTLKLKPLADFAGDAESDADLDTLSQRFFSEYREMIKEFDDYFIPWQIAADIEPVYVGENVVTVKSEMFLQTGGAHPNTFVNYYSFNLADGNQIKLSDVFKPGSENELNLTAEKLFREEKKIPSGESLKKLGYWFEGDKFKLNDNFGILKDGIVFHFNAYEIAPYAMGHTELTIPFKDIKKLLTEKEWK